MTPDEARPTGGIAQMYAMVDGLNLLGYEAAVLHGKSGFRCAWFDSRTPVVTSARMVLQRGDLLIMPEYGGNGHAHLAGDANVVILNQNHFGTFHGAGFANSWGSDGYPGWPNAVAVIATSKAIRRFLAAVLPEAFPLHSARYVVDATTFHPARKRNIVAFMPRKRRNDAAHVVQLLLRSSVMRNWEIRPIENMKRDEVAGILSEAAIFLGFADHEGFGLPAAEAMAAGCYVVGFAADGGREFMLPEFCSPIEEPDVVSFVQEVERVAAAWSRQDPALGEKLAQARAYVQESYSGEAMSRDLEVAFGSLSRSDSPARQPSPVEITHYSYVARPTRRQRIRKRVRPWVPETLARYTRALRHS